MKMTDKLFRAIMRNLHAYVLLINRDFTVFLHQLLRYYRSCKACRNQTGGRYSAL